MIALESLRCCELFPGLSDEELAQIAAIAHEETFQPGDQICAEQEAANHLFILQKGCVQVHIRLRPDLEPGGETTIEEVEPGRIFGWSSLIKQRRFTASAKALELTTVVALRADALDALFTHNPHLGFVVMKQLAEVIASRLRHMREVCQDTEHTM